MSGRWVLAGLALLCGTAAGAQPEEGTVDAHPLALPSAEAFALSHRAGAPRLLFVAPIEASAHAVVSATGSLTESHTEVSGQVTERRAGPGGFIRLGPSRLQIMERPGYQEGLPVPEDVAMLDQMTPIDSNGFIVLGAGPLTWLHVNVETFREESGARRYRFVPLPGVVLKPTGVPIQAGFSVLVAFKRKPDAYSDELRRAMGFLQLSGRF